MVSITLSVPEETRKLMKKFSEVNWSGFVRACIIDKAKKLALKEELLRGLEEEKENDALALEIGRSMKENIWKKYRKKGW